VVHGLVAVVVVVGSLALVGCPDDDINTDGPQRVRLDPATVRTSVTPDNSRILADRDIDLNLAAFLVDPGSTLASSGQTVTVRVSNIVSISATEARGAFVVIAVGEDGIEREFARGTPSAANVTAANTRGVLFQGTNCRFKPDAGSLISPETNFTTCRIAVGTKTGTGGEPGVPINGAIEGNLQLIVANPSSGVTFTSDTIAVTVGLNDNGDGTGSVIVDGRDTSIDVLF
jgi:hypothetical protein